jgi:hypothetical protein
MLREKKERSNLGPSKSSFRFEEGTRQVEPSHRGACGVGLVTGQQEARRQAQGKYDKEKEAWRSDASGSKAAVTGYEEALGRAQENREIDAPGPKKTHLALAPRTLRRITGMGMPAILRR